MQYFKMLLWLIYLFFVNINIICNHIAKTKNINISNKSKQIGKKLEHV